MIRRMWLPGVIASLAMLASIACRRAEDDPMSFVKSLRCGMTRAEVTRLAHEHHYDPSDKGWLERSTANASKSSKQLRLIDLRFHQDRLIGLRQGDYDPRTKRIEYREVDLCGGGE